MFLNDVNLEEFYCRDSSGIPGSIRVAASVGNDITCLLGRDCSGFVGTGGRTETSRIQGGSENLWGSVAGLNDVRHLFKRAVGTEGRTETRRCQ